MKNFSLVCLIVSLFVTSPASADEGREFFLSCTYGILAGSLVGAASLATEDEPDEKLHRIARGASIGLYTGILLGLYVIYIVPSQLESDQQEELDQLNEDAGDLGMRIEPPRFMIYPVIEQNRVTGAAMNYSVLKF